jgi:mannosyltransferase OCH1-like enzyme
MIPKIIHSVWVGDNLMPKREKDLLIHNKKFSRDHNYVYNLWNNETIGEICPEGSSLHKFVSEALRKKKYAHASDCLKLLALKKYGGWSIDSDNKLLDSFDVFLEHNWVSGFELYKNRKFPITAVWGAIPNHPFTQKLLNYYESEDFSSIIKIPNTEFISKILINSGGIINNDTEQYSEELDVYLYPHWVFCTAYEDERKSYATHLFLGSWKG